MDSIQFRKFLEEQDVSRNTIDSIINWVIESERFLNKQFDEIVANDDETYKALYALKQIDKAFGLSTQYSLRKYYEYVNGKKFPKLNRYHLSDVANSGLDVVDKTQADIDVETIKNKDLKYRAHFGKYSFLIPECFKPDIEEDDRIRAYASKGDNVVMLMIGKEINDEYGYYEKWIKEETTRKEMTENFLSGLADKGHVEFISGDMIELGSTNGYMISFSFNILDTPGKGWYYVFWVDRDNWFYAGLMQSDSTDKDYYEDYIEIIQSFEGKIDLSEVETQAETNYTGDEKVNGLLIRLVKDLEDTRSEYRGFSYVRTIRNILIGKEDAAIAPFFEGKPYYGIFETLTLEQVEQMMDSLVVTANLMLCTLSMVNCIAHVSLLIKKQIIPIV